MNVLLSNVLLNKSKIVDLQNLNDFYRSFFSSSPWIWQQRSSQISTQCPLKLLFFIFDFFFHSQLNQLLWVMCVCVLHSWCYKQCCLRSPPWISQPASVSPETCESLGWMAGWAPLSSGLLERWPSSPYSAALKYHEDKCAFVVIHTIHAHAVTLQETPACTCSVALDDTNAMPY